MINKNVVQITEILGRTELGISKPFRCRGEDGRTYIVKGKNTNLLSLRNEWLAGCLAVPLGIPIAPFSIVEIQEVLINVAPPELRQVGHGLAFGSVQNDGMTLDLGRCTANLVDASDRRNIIAFDWWVRNEDRKLTEHGGNVNLLWNDNSRRVVVFDHNLAFDESFNTADFFAEHVFRTDWYDVAGDFFYREEYQKRFAHALSFFEGACDAMPIDWRPDFDGQPVSPSERLIFDKLRLYDAYGYWDTKK